MRVGTNVGSNDEHSFEAAHGTAQSIDLMAFGGLATLLTSRKIRFALLTLHRS
jgi:hypothetical protein